MTETILQYKGIIHPKWMLIIAFPKHFVVNYSFIKQKHF